MFRLFVLISVMLSLVACNTAKVKKVGKVAIVGATALAVTNPPVAVLVTAVDAATEFLIEVQPKERRVENGLEVVVFSFEAIVDGVVLLVIVWLLLMFIGRPLSAHIIRKINQRGIKNDYSENG